MNRHWDAYGTHDLARLPRQHLVAVLPVAAIEQHGPHLPLSTDRIILEGLIAATIERLPDSLPALFLPIQAVGKSDAHIRFPGTLTLSAGTLLQLLVEIGSSVAVAGVRKLILLNSHGGNSPVLDLAARELRIAHDIVAVSANWYAFGLPDGILSERERRHGLHGGALETSLMLALRPDLVRMERARDFESLTERLDRNFHHLGRGARRRPRMAGAGSQSRRRRGRRDGGQRRDGTRDPRARRRHPRQADRRRLPLPRRPSAQSDRDVRLAS
jgi:creatinine amidohydrolase